MPNMPIMPMADQLYTMTQHQRLDPDLHPDLDPDLAAAVSCRFESGPHPHVLHLYRLTDDWRGITNQRERKKLQNKINKRLSRQRRRASPASSSSPSSAASSSASPPSALSPASPAILPSTFSYCTAEDLPRKRAMLARFAEQALASYRAGNPSADHRLRIIQLNTINGLTCNAAALGFSFDWLICETLSPIGPLPASSPGVFGPRPALRFAIRNAALGPLGLDAPSSLVPTDKQKSVPHHPWLDLFPLPRMRDNFIEACTARLSAEEEERLYQDIIESGGTTRSEWAGLSIWGDPWDPFHWEVSVAFLRRWGWLLRGCPELIESTNYWRRQRGEDPVAYSDYDRVEELPDC